MYKSDPYKTCGLSKSMNHVTECLGREGKLNGDLL